jgi:hypothetical protein
MHPPQKFKPPPFWNDRGHLKRQLRTKFYPNPPIGANLHPPQKFKPPPFEMIEVTFIVITSVHSCIQLHQSVQKLLGGLFSPTSNLNVRHFGMVTITGLKGMESRSPLMSSPPYKILSKSTSRFKYCTHLWSLNLCHFGMVTGTLWNLDHL